MKEKKVGEYITYALFDLLKTKNLEQITTTEIIKKAGVCRSSFYRNFYLPEDVIRQYGIALLEEINSQCPIEQANLREHIYTANTILWSQRERLALLEDRGLFHLLEGPIIDHCVLQIQRLGLQTHRYCAEYHAGATTQLIRAWIHYGFEESPQEITDLICQLGKQIPAKL